MTDKMTAEQLECEIEKIAQYIVEAKLEIAALSHTTEENGTDKNLSHASLELNEVVRHTEEATNLIMDKADAIMAIAGGLSDTEISAQLNEHAVGILESCSFQDITGQRIRKVLGTLEQIELRVNRLVKLFGGTLPENLAIAPIVTGARRPDEDLCNGPQLSKDKPSQDDIDKFFASN
jgi:chemotaxis protein CheZ